MTDYIADLLREQEEREESRTENDWRKAWEETTLPVTDKKAEPAGPATTAGGAAEPALAAEKSPAGETAEAGAAAALRLLGEGAGAAVTAAGTEAAEVALHTPAGGDWVYQALRQSLTELPAPRRESRGGTLQKPGEKTQPGGWDAAGLDRLVRRDARRFDGGFQLL